MGVIRAVSKREMKTNKEIREQTKRLLKLVAQINATEKEGDKNETL